MSGARRSMVNLLSQIYVLLWLATLSDEQIERLEMRGIG